MLLHDLDVADRREGTRVREIVASVFIPLFVSSTQWRLTRKLRAVLAQYAIMDRTAADVFVRMAPEPFEQKETKWLAIAAAKREAADAQNEQQDGAVVAETTAKMAARRRKERRLLKEARENFRARTQQPPRDVHEAAMPVHDIEGDAAS